MSVILRSLSPFRWIIFTFGRLLSYPFYKLKAFKVQDPSRGDTESDRAISHKHCTLQEGKLGRCSKYPTVITYRHIRADAEAEIPIPKFGEVIYISKGEFITRGGTAILERLPSGNVVKTPTPNPYFLQEEDDCRRNMRLEALIYKTINGHPRVPKCIDWDPTTCCLTIEYLVNGDLREYVKRNHETITADLRRKWAKQAAEGLRILHCLDIIHCDISPRNFLLDPNLDLKISDFAGSSLLGSMPSAFSNTRYRHPNCNWDVPRFEDDIFGLGSLIYFIMTSDYPFAEVPSDEVETLYKRLEFPDVCHIACGSIIEQCWFQTVDATDVYEYFKVMDD
ncbi:kinase-like protein [Aspergillus coremiiformis]|uniref:EKC/KEOPS complex subunit BUD32 n=1 Tax=Aspergillus coremiiformis TaxID=138285 RepID=A0A5N6Z081_9EURO|nr:kinase-like protein [Aspergillus coremiiformis]